MAVREAPNTRLQAVHAAQAAFQSDGWAVRQVCEGREQAHRAQHRRADREQRIAPVDAQRVRQERGEDTSCKALELVGLPIQ